jgi:hypothetical protein
MTDGVMTAERLMAAWNALKTMPTAPPPPHRVLFSVYALKETEERLFPASKNRSARIRKKLIKRFGGEFQKEPAMWVAGDTIIAHPVYRSRLEQQFPHIQSAILRGAPAFGFGGLSDFLAARPTSRF